MSMVNNNDFYMSTTWTTATTTDDSDNFSNYSSGQSFTVKMPGVAIAKEKKSGSIYSKYVTHEMLVYYPRSDKDYTGKNQNQGPGALPFVNVRELLATFFIRTYFHTERVKNWRGRVIGITSMLDVKHASYRGDHMPMFDYDGNVKKKIKKDVATFQDKYGLGDAWVYRTKKGYHVYFFCDHVSYEIYMQMIAEAGCCLGFKEQTNNNGFSVLRLSAKYTSFNIELEYILKSKNTAVVKRPLRKAHLIQEIIGMGQKCGTHFASMLPQWSRYKEDPKEWRAPPKPRKRRVVKKNSRFAFNPQDVLAMKAEMTYKREKEMLYSRDVNGEMVVEQPPGVAFDVEMRKMEERYLGLNVAPPSMGGSPIMGPPQTVGERMVAEIKQPIYQVGKYVTDYDGDDEDDTPELYGLDEIKDF